MNKFLAAEHGGTHMDAPRHFFKEGWSVDQIPPDHLVAPAVVVDISSRARTNPDALLTVDDLETWQKSHDQIPEKSVVFMHSGWDAFWPNKTAIFGNEDLNTTDLHFPGFDPSAVEWLCSERAIYGIGVDTPSVDHGPSLKFEAHVLMTSYNVYGLENVKNLGKMPASGATVFVMPMAIGGGSGGPTRIVASWGDECTGSGASGDVRVSSLILRVCFWQ